jgi:3-phosphoglycerate kinase
MAYYKLNDFDFSGKRVLIRTGFDVPVDDSGNISDDRRIRLSIPTIDSILEKNPAKLIIIFHIGRPKGKEEKLSSKKTAIRLSELLGRPVGVAAGWGEAGLPPEQIVILENVRFHPGEKSKNEADRDAFAKQLSSLADYFVMDAFSNMHHGEQASMDGVMKYLPSCLGTSAEQEIDTITNAIEKPERPFISIIGGLKAEKLNAVHNLLRKVDKIIIAGALAFTVLKSQGYQMGSSKIDFEGLNSMQQLFTELKDNPKVLLPVDAVIADRFDRDAQSETVRIDAVQEGWMALDIGPESVRLYKDEILKAKTIIWNGPIGVFEFEKFATGTKEIAQALASCGAKVIVGGGDSADVIDKLGLEHKITFVSTGGGASLMMFEGQKLPLIEELEKNHEKFQD